MNPTQNLKTAEDNYKHNQENSSLILSIPAEIREKIFSYLEPKQINSICTTFYNDALYIAKERKIRDLKKFKPLINALKPYSKNETDKKLLSDLNFKNYILDSKDYSFLQKNYQKEVYNKIKVIDEKLAEDPKYDEICESIFKDSRCRETNIDLLLYGLTKETLSKEEKDIILNNVVDELLHLYKIEEKKSDDIFAFEILPLLSENFPNLSNNEKIEKLSKIFPNSSNKHYLLVACIKELVEKKIELIEIKKFLQLILKNPK